ncbi:MAG: T9SS type A sorting domain-containing protein [Fluviicola sp.]
MKLSITLLIFSVPLLIFGQEKGIPGLGAHVEFIHHSALTDFLKIDNSQLDLVSSDGNFELIASDSVYYRITLEEGDSLNYTAYWRSGNTSDIPSDQVADSVVMVVSGNSFATDFYFGFDPGFSNASRKTEWGVIRSSCLIQIEAIYTNDSPVTFLEVKFVDKDLSQGNEITVNDLSATRTDVTNLKISGTANLATELLLFNSSGQLVINQTLFEDQLVDISKLGSGIYMLQLQRNDGNRLQLKFVF